MTDLPILPDWVLIEGAKRAGWSNTYTADYLQHSYDNNGSYRALCDMIAKHEQKPVDRKLLCARQALHEGRTIEEVSVRAIELWEEGFGK